MVHCMLVVCLAVRVVRAIMGLHTHSSRLHKASMPGRLSRLLNCRQPQLLKNLHSYGKTTRNRLRRCVYLRVCVCLSVCTFVCLPWHHKASMLEKLSTLLNCRQPQLLKNLHSYGKTTRNRLRWCVYLYSIKRWTPDL